mmetsp:Transcript_23629/g.27875  ORF Transcript_23629/g.27875 Transcript_23629/m.27875 type:complete len:231 (+) Transcript_23629:99-791(+)|eukprot:CAMPEP_0198264014 /NCGR_PEP_ID=MMETSP1447-20131203/14420_1 /TAXON_ID=420782 /ORGANISM="Chaetoceros dichaeta, Strain CCMP1751" /LENGTH=230 /DNA_ID=CAMNT_0043952809 /DNA_START=57 /DNA_END=749 /DNA_ORIENTATION=+
MKLTNSAFVFLSCLRASSGFVQQPFIQHASSISPPTAYAVRAEEVISSSSSLFASTDGADVESVHRDADVIFALIDIDGDANVSLEEITDHLSVAGYTEKVIKQIFVKMDTNKDNQISKDEFRNGMVLIKALQTAPGLGNYNAQFLNEIHEDADQVFQSADSDGNGKISEFELKSHIRRTLPKYSDEAVDNIFKSIDHNNDKKISRTELRDAFVRCSALRQAIGEGPNFK